MGRKRKNGHSHKGWKTAARKRLGPRAFTFILFQNETEVAEVTSADRDEALREIMHYAFMYAQDGPVVVREAHGW